MLEAEYLYLLNMLEVNEFDFVKVASQLKISQEELKDEMRRDGLTKWISENRQNAGMLGWKIGFYGGSLILCKGTMLSLIVYPNYVPENYRFLQKMKHRVNCFMEWYVFDPYLQIIDGFYGFVPRNKIYRKTNRMLFGHLQPFSSGDTNVQKIKKYYLTYKSYFP